MAVTKRGKVYHLRIRPFGPELITVRTPTPNKSEAKRIERAVLTACQARDYRFLDPDSRAVCVSMFRNRDLKIPSDLIGTEPTSKELSLWQATDIFLNYPEIKDSRERERYAMCLIHLVRHFGKEAPIMSILVPQIKSYMSKRLSEGAAPATVNREKGTLSRLFQVLIEHQFMEMNPCRLVKNLSQKSGERQVYLSLSDVRRIMESVPSWFKPIIQTAYYTGMRRGEILSLTRRQINLPQRIIYLGPKNTKENNWKRVPLHRDMVPVFEQVMRVSCLGTDKVFLLQDKKGLRPPSVETFNNCWPRACEALELEKPRPHFHDLRHTWRANARRSGVDPDVAESILGHWSRGRRVNERYGRIGDEELIHNIDRMTFDHGETEILVASF